MHHGGVGAGKKKKKRRKPKMQVEMGEDGAYNDGDQQSVDQHGEDGNDNEHDDARRMFENQMMMATGSKFAEPDNIGSQANQSSGLDH